MGEKTNQKTVRKVGKTLDIIAVVIIIVGFIVMLISWILWPSIQTEINSQDYVDVSEYRNDDKTD